MESVARHEAKQDEQNPSTIEVLSYCTFNGKKSMAVQPHLGVNAFTVTKRRDQITVGTAHDSSHDSCSDMLSVQCSTARSLQTQAVTICEIESIGSAKEGNARYWGPICYIKHRNLEVRPLTFFEQIRLARVHYLTTANGIRLFLVLFFLAWFVFNAFTIWQDFRYHEGIVYLEYQTPNRSHPPGITICSHCILCSYVSQCCIYSSITMNMYRFQNESTVYADYLLNNDSTWKAVEPYSSNDHDDKDFEVKCRLFSNSYEPPSKQNTFDCVQIAAVVRSAEEGHKCFTYFSNIYGKKSMMIDNSKMEPDLLKFDQVPVIRFEISGKFLLGKSVYRLERIKNSIHKSSWGDMRTDRSGISYSGIYVSLHDPDILPDMSSLQYYRLQAGKVTVIPFRKRIHKLKPTEGTDNCYSYRNDYSRLVLDQMDIEGFVRRSNITTGASLSLYRSRSECFLYCLWRLLNAKRCVNLFSIFTLEMVQQEQYYRKWLHSIKSGLDDDLATEQNYPRWRVQFCGRSIDSYRAYLAGRQRCMLLCPSNCTVENFAEESVYSYAFQGQANSTYLEVLWSRQPITYVEQRTKMNIHEFLGSLGGQAHIWLGISIPYLIGYVIRLVQWGEFLPEHTCCCVLTWWRSCFVRSTRRRTNA